MPREPAAARGAVVLRRIEIDHVLRRLARDRVERGERLLFEFGDGGTRVGARDREQVLGASTVRRTRAGRRDDLGRDADAREDAADLAQAREAALGDEDGVLEVHGGSLSDRTCTGRFVEP
jgi:hypothetical protein